MATDDVSLGMSAQVADALLVLITAANEREAKRLAEALITDRLASCVQILPRMESVYRWQGRIENETEILLLIKTTANKFEELERTARGLHTYDVPEILAVPVTRISEPYFKWLVEALEP
jgi:periplasmic divalent cation tolerance protein